GERARASLILEYDAHGNNGPAVEARIFHPAAHHPAGAAVCPRGPHISRNSLTSRARPTYSAIHTHTVPWRTPWFCNDGARVRARCRVAPRRHHVWRPV